MTTTNDDIATAAQKQLWQAQAILHLVNADFDRESIVQAIKAEDWSLLRPAT